MAMLSSDPTRRSRVVMPRPPHPNKQILVHQVAAWEAYRNAHHAKTDWQFTTDDAQIKLSIYYPTF